MSTREKKFISVVPKTIYVRENLWRRLKVIAACRNITLAEVIEKAFDDYAREYGENDEPR